MTEIDTQTQLETDKSNEEVENPEMVEKIRELMDDPEALDKAVNNIANHLNGAEKFLNETEPDTISDYKFKAKKVARLLNIDKVKARKMIKNLSKLRRVEKPFKGFGRR